MFMHVCAIFYKGMFNILKSQSSDDCIQILMKIFCLATNENCIGYDYESRAGIKDGKDRDEDDRVTVWCFSERKTVHH